MFISSFTETTFKIFIGTPLVTEETETTTPRPCYIFDTQPLVNYMIEYVKNNWQKFVVYPTTTSTTTAK